MAVTSTPRLSVSLTDEDEKLLIKLRSAMELKSQKRLSLAEVIRASIRCKAIEENVEVSAL